MCKMWTSEPNWLKLNSPASALILIKALNLSVPHFPISKMQRVMTPLLKGNLGRLKCDYERVTLGTTPGLQLALFNVSCSSEEKHRVF